MTSCPLRGLTFAPRYSFFAALRFFSLLSPNTHLSTLLFSLVYCTYTAPKWSELVPSPPNPARVREISLQRQCDSPCAYDQRWHNTMGIGAMARIMLISTGSSVVDLPQNLQHQIQEYEETFTVSTETLKKVVDHFEKELEKGKLAYTGFLPCLPVY